MDTDVGLDQYMRERERNEQGRYTEEYDSEDFLTAVLEHEPATTTEVADAVGCVRQNADYRLRRLEDEGKVESKKVGPSLIWTMKKSTCERCGEQTPRADARLITLTSAMDPVEPHEEAPISDASVYELCSNCADEWHERLHSSESLSFSSFLEDVE